ncbi:acyltransferase family protein [Mycolicibacterium sp. 050158]|uniref:acyltransferase family protein n=1 Tax=Mycolicibacterium sp. 050158 TaxID=3090602 RepID=UPI00299F01BD|nr:acyltransferase family protein [Mycolicibacterium sp. 050158]MDX1888192.1 acyltransferase family protein [Mycolicibacterium sp. 050158]
MRFLGGHQSNSRRHGGRSKATGQRLDLQGLRMLAVLAVFVNHLFGWPRGGFVGVDVFFVISGFLITGNLLRTAEATGTVSFRKFYWNRVRRIVPAATVVLTLTYAAAVLVFLPFRSHQVGIDALFAFVFAANWHFAAQGTDYFATAAESVSPIRHYWSLSIEEQFYFVWPAVIFAISVVIIRKGWRHDRRMQLAGAVMSAIVLVSFGWAVIETGSTPTLAYFDTFARVWELGVGAIAAIGAGRLARLPMNVKPWLSWLGVVLIAASMLLLSDTSDGFPAPWALLPVAGAAAIVAAGVGGEPAYQQFLRNPISTYVGDISYSLYLVHWPVIVILGAMMEVGSYYYVTVVTASFACAIASYHLVENPLRRVTIGKLREVRHQIFVGAYWPAKASQHALLAAGTLLVVSLCAYVMQPTKMSSIPPDLAVSATSAQPTAAAKPVLPPQAADLNREIVAALQATEFPQFDPPADQVLGSGPKAPPEVAGCQYDPGPPEDRCTWGTSTASKRLVIIGDSLAAGYAAPLRDIAMSSNGRLQVHMESTPGCTFVDGPVVGGGESWIDTCASDKQRAIDLINQLKPDIVIISNSYTSKHEVGSDSVLSGGQWRDAMRNFVEKFSASSSKVVFMSPPPMDKKISDCYGVRSRTPADCISKVTSQWKSMAQAEQQLAASIGGTWIDSQPWFCTVEGLCPSFVRNTLTKTDEVHMTPTYGQRITPVIDESLQTAGVL